MHLHGDQRVCSQKNVGQNIIEVCQTINKLSLYYSGFCEVYGLGSCWVLFPLAMPGGL